VPVYSATASSALAPKDVMSFLGRKLTGDFSGEIVSDMKVGGRHRRIPGCRIKDRANESWPKMHDKAGSVLRVEMGIHYPEESSFTRSSVDSATSPGSARRVRRGGRGRRQGGRKTGAIRNPMAGETYESSRRSV